MKTTGTMLKQLLVRARFALCPALAISLALVLSGCNTKQALVAPEVTVSPYGALAQTPVLAIAPLRNESGVSFADTLRVSDALANRASEIRGMACLPVNRTLAAMRALRMNDVRSPEDARRLAAAVGADAIIVGSLTAYDPYDPPKIGITIGLYGRDGSILTGVARKPLDVKDLQTQPDETRWASTNFNASGPLSVISEHYDAANHEILISVQRYSEGRHREASALGWERYVKSMDLYVDFAAYRAMDRLMQEERLRLARLAPPPKSNPR
ncbi:MAG: hypothetical protein K2X32_00635 [Phycisphaerales bacterium]|nr:hypothetical protein [Phycisphaerales bacterium]